MKKNESANILGEYLRNKSFLNDGNNTIGCYDTFKVSPDFKKLKPTSRKFQRMVNIILFGNDSETLGDISIDNEDFKNLHNEYQNIKNYNNLYYNRDDDVLMGFYWDGDGILVFKQGDTIIINTDCKKDYGWKFIK